MRLDQLKQKQRMLYASIGSVFCPALRGTVFFNSEGFNHLINESNRKPRTTQEQYLKLSCLDDAVAVIKYCPRVSGTRITRRKVKGVGREVARYELVHEVKLNVRIRVVVERIGTGNYKFLSIMPHKRSSKPKKRP